MAQKTTQVLKSVTGNLDRLANRPLAEKPVTISMTRVFVPVCLIVLKQPIKLDFLWAGLCLVGAVYFIFRSS